jgi:hypothetical protein
MSYSIGELGYGEHRIIQVYQILLNNNSLSQAIEIKLHPNNKTGRMSSCADCGSLFSSPSRKERKRSSSMLI